MDKTNIILTSCLGVAFILLHVCGIFLPVEFLWGLDHWQYFPGLFALILAFTGLVICIFPLLAKKPSLKIEPNIFANRLFFLLIPAGSFFFFWILRQRTFFLGDGYFYIRILGDGIRYRALEPIDVFLHSLFHEFINKIITMSPQDSWAMVSSIVGVLFVFLAMRLSDYLGTAYRDKLVIFFAILSMGAVQLYYGYIETYSISTFFAFLFIYFALRSFARRSFVYASFFVFSLGICSHISILGFSLAFIYLYFIHVVEANSVKNRIKLTLGIFSAFILPIAITLLIFLTGGFPLQRFMKQYSAEGHLLPLLPGKLAPNVSYSLFSYMHFIDIWNELMLIAPISFFALFLLIFNYNKIKNILVSNKIIFLLAATSSSLLFCFLFNMEIGVSRDWDIFSALALPLTLASILIVIAIFKDKIGHAGIIILGCCWLHTMPWVILNANEHYSLARFLKLTSSSTWNRHAKSYAFDELRSYYEENNDLNASLKWAERAYEQLGNERYRLNLAASYNNVAKMYAKQKRLSEAEALFQRALTYYPNDFLTIRNMALLYFEQKQHDKSLEYFEKAMSIEPNDVESLRKTARIYYIKGRYDKADTYLSRALQANQDRNIEKQLHLLRNQIDKKVSE
jgi:tetratricopeptide (TPR) repeat protein